MVQEVERLNRVIGQLLEFARPVTMKLKPTSLTRLMQHSLRMVEIDAALTSDGRGSGPGEPNRDKHEPFPGHQKVPS
jgi:two-component system sensor histidine kinase HydH